MTPFFGQISVAVKKPFVKIIEKPNPVLYLGAGKAQKVGALMTGCAVNKVMVLTDHFLHTSGLLTPIFESLQTAGVSYVVFDAVRPDPTFDVVDEAYKMYAGCEAIIAVGGGSVMDTAKAVGASVANNKPAIRMAGLLKVKKRLPFLVAVPTTAGTGSETTVAAVISDPKTHAKKQILSPKIVPQVAILDPTLTTGLPPAPTAYTALDALTHALEAYTAGYADVQTDRYATSAIKLIYENVNAALQSPKDLAVREALQEAAFYAGMAFTRTYVGYVHAFAHTIGGRFGVPHGLATAVLLPHVMQFYQDTCKSRFAELADLLGICDKNDTIGAKAQKMVQSLFALNESLQVPQYFEKFPKEEIESVIAAAFRECHGVYPVPKYYTHQQARELMQKVCAQQ